MQLDYLNSYAVAHIDGQRAGELHFPGGELEITDYCRPGATHQLAVWVLALPLKAILLSYTDSASAREAKGTVARRGLCGDIFVVSTPPKARIRDVRADTSVRQKELNCTAALDALARDQVYRLRTRIAAGVRQRRRALGVPPGGVERSVPRRPRLRHQRAGEGQHALGSAPTARRSSLASLGLPAPGRLEPETRPRHGPTVPWCGLPVTRLWRCGKQGNAASVLIEKPARGDFLPILDGGYSLQYSPLLEDRDNQGLALFCQVDVTGRTEVEPAAEILVQNLLRYVSAWKPPGQRSVVYAGDPLGRSHLESVGEPGGDAPFLPALSQAGQGD